MTPHDDRLDARATTVGVEDAAGRLGLQPSTLANMRWSGRGPTYIKCGGRVRYRLMDLAEWLDAQARSSTSGRSNGHGAQQEE